VKRFAIGLLLTATADAAPADFVENAQAVSGDGAILVWAALHRDLWQVVARRVEGGGRQSPR